MFLFGAFLSGCPRRPVDGDGAVPFDATRPARVVLRIGAAAESLEDDVVLEALRLGIVEARARNDRGTDMEPFERDLGIVDVRLSPAWITLEDAPPATYSRVALTLSSFELRLTEGEITIQVDIASELAIDVRCDEAVPLGPGEEIVLAGALDLGEVHAALRESELPAPSEGVIYVDAARAPAAVAAVETRLRERWFVECEDEEEEEGDEL